MHDVDLHLVGRQLGQRLRQALVDALHVGLDDELQRLDFVLADFAEHVLELGGLLLRQLDVAELALAEQRDFARLALIAQHHHVFAGERHVGQALDFHRNGRAGFVDRLAGLVDHRPHAAEYRAGQHDVAALQRSRLHQDGRDRAAALVQARFDHDAARRRVLGRFQFQHLGLQQQRFEQAVDAVAGLGRHLDELHVAALFFRQHRLGHQFLLTRSGLASGLSILLIATTIGTFAALA